ncbi:MAG: choice-of-anchor Q domain-containing protein [Rubrobacteraceae bacterium]
MLAKNVFVVARVLAVTIALIAAILVVAAGPARAADFVVNSNGDSGTGGCNATECTLREAIEAANTNGQADKITFTATGQITLTNTQQRQLEIKDDAAGLDLTITGLGATGTTVAQKSPISDRVFYIGNKAQAVIEQLTITGGDAGSGGGGIFVDNSTLSLEDAAVRGNRTNFFGGGIFQFGGSVTISSSTVSDNVGVEGGGIYQSGGTLTVVESTISGNSGAPGRTAGRGGGIYQAAGTMTVESSTISGNRALEIGGGILSSGGATITNSTISGNNAGATNQSGGGGVYNAAGLVDITYTTITNNSALGFPDGSGVVNVDSARAEVGSSIIAGNQDGDVDVDGAPRQSFTSKGYNVIGTGGATGAFTTSGDRTNVTNPLLGPLADNSGPTQTHALLKGSPAIDRVTKGCPPPATDQRAVARPQGATCDSGSFERKVSQLSLPPAAKANLSLSKKASKGRLTVGQKLTYTLRLKNNGPDRATGVKIVDTLPRGVKVLSTSKGCKKQSARKVRCNIGTLADGRRIAKKIVVKVNRSGKLVNRAKATSSVGDPNAKNNRARAVVRAKAKRLSCKVKNPTVRLAQGKQVVVVDSKPGKSVACVVQGNQQALARTLKNKPLGVVKQGGKQVRAAKGKVIKSGARRVVVRVSKGF